MDHSIGNRFGSPKTTMPLVLNMAMASTIAIAKMMATFTMAAETCAANENDGDVDDNVDAGDEQLVTETSAIAKCFGVHAWLSGLTWSYVPTKTSLAGYGDCLPCC